MTSAGAGKLEIRRAQPGDIPLLLTFIRELAEYERLSHEVLATEQKLERTLFGPTPFAHALLAFVGETPAGFAVYFFTFSTFAARSILYLEDLFVRPAFRRQGTGRKLFREIIKVARMSNCVRIDWTVLHWNTDALEFYRRLGAESHREWVRYSLPLSCHENVALEAGESG